MPITRSLKNELNALGEAPIYACRAWLNANGAGTVAVKDSGNVSSFIDNGTGDYTINFIKPMPDNNYSVAFAIATTTGTATAKIRAGSNDGPATLKTTTQLRILITGASSAFDCEEISVSIFR
jgi:hypothetical protein